MDIKNALYRQMNGTLRPLVPVNRCWTIHDRIKEAPLPEEMKEASKEEIWRAALEELNDNQHTQRSVKGLVEQVIALQGKVAVLRHENNQLRKKVTKQKPGLAPSDPAPQE